MSETIRKYIPSGLIDQSDPEQPQTGTATNPVRVDPTGTTVQPVNVVSGGGSATPSNNFHLVAAGSGDAHNVKATAGTVFSVTVSMNPASGPAPIYVKLHNNAGTPTPGAGVVQTVQAESGRTTHVPFPVGVKFTTGIAVTLVTGIADSSSTGVAAGSCVLDLGWQ